MSRLARQSSPESENTRARPSLIDASSPLFLDSSEVLADPDNDASDSERTRSPRASYVALAELPQLPAGARANETARTGNVRSSYVASSERNEAPVLSRRRPSFVASSERSETAVPTPPASHVRSSSSYAAADEIAPFPSPSSLPAPLSPVLPTRASSPDSETGFVVAAPSSRAARASFVASGEIDRSSSESRQAPDYDRESVTNCAVSSPRASYVAPCEMEGSYAVVEGDDGSYTTSEIEQVVERSDAYDSFATAQIEGRAQHILPPNEAPLDYDELRRFLFDEPSLAPPPAATAYDPISPSEHVHDGTMRLSTRHLQPQPPVQPIATIRASSFAPQSNRAVSNAAFDSFEPFAPSGETPVVQVQAPVSPTTARRPTFAGPSGETPVQPVASHFARHHLAQPRLPAMPERSQLGRAVDAVRMHLAQSMAARTELLNSHSTARRQSYGQYSSAPPGDPSLTSSVDSPWIVPTSPTPRRMAPLPPPPFKVTFALIAAAVIALFAVGIVVAALVFVHSTEEKSRTSAAAANTTDNVAPTPVPALDSPPPPPAQTSVVIAPPPPASPPPALTIAAPPAEVKAPKANAKANEGGAASAAASPSPRATTDKTASADKSATPRATTTTATTAPAPRAKTAPATTSSNKPKSVEQMLDELGEEQLRR